MNVLNVSKIKQFLVNQDEQQLVRLKNEIAHLLIKDMVRNEQIEQIVDRTEVAISGLNAFDPSEQRTFQKIVNSILCLIETSNMHFSSSLKELSHYPYWVKSGFIEKTTQVESLKIKVAEKVAS